jgi:hypothetical protein
VWTPQAAGSALLAGARPSSHGFVAAAKVESDQQIAEPRVPWCPDEFINVLRRPLTQHGDNTGRHHARV